MSRNLYFYTNIKLKDTLETRIYLMFMHFAVILIIFKNKKTTFPQEIYDSLFHSIENNFRELGLGDVAVNKKMKEINKIFYDILIKFYKNEESYKVNEKLIVKYFPEIIDYNSKKYTYFDLYFTKFYKYCFANDPKIMIKEALKFKVE